MNTKPFLRINLGINLALVYAFLLVITMHAQETKIYNPSGIINPNTKIISSNQVLQDQIKLYNQNKTTSPKKEGQNCNITINFEYDPTQFQAPWIAFLIDLNDLTNYTPIFDYYGNGIIEGQVSPGTYDIVTSFSHGMESYYVISENVEITNDMTITLNPSKSTNVIKTRFLDPNGELLKHSIGHFNDNNEFIIDEKGNIDFSLVANKLYRKGCGNLTGTSLITIGPVLNEDERNIPLNVYVNDISDNYIFIQDRIFCTEDLSNSFICHFSTDNINVGTIENSPNDFVHHIYNYKYTPDGSQQVGWGLENKIWYNANSFTNLGLSFSEPKPRENAYHELWMNIPYSDPITSEYNLMLQTNFLDSFLESPGIQIKRWTQGQVLRVEDGEKEFVNIGHHNIDENWGSYSSNSLYNENINGQITWLFTNTPVAFCYPAEQTLGIIGDNCPINALKIQTYENGEQINLSRTNYFVGRYGETRWCNEGANEGITVTTKFNGTEVNLDSFTPDGKGIYEISVTNTNIEVDGLPGHNTTTVYFDQNQEDMTPPSIEMMHFKNNDGGITDRFNTAADGMIEFYATDFDYHYYPDMWNGLFEVKPVEIQVEYAPYNTEEWEELPVVEIPELFQEPGWGYFYRGTLANVTGQAEKGWFDLKFRFEDVAGNWQEQVVSPAFRIDDLSITGINEITLAHPNDDNTIYNLAGQRMNGDINNLPRGIYIVGGKKVIK